MRRLIHLNPTLPVDTTIYSELGKQAIAGASAAGADVRDEAEFDLLQDEIAKLSNPGASGTPDWNRVVQLSARCWRTRARMCWSPVILPQPVETRGLPGLADGLRVLSDLFEQYWESLFPPLQRMRGRRNALQWLADSIQRHAGEVDWSAMPPQEPELVASLRQRLEAIDAVLRARGRRRAVAAAAHQPGQYAAAAGAGPGAGVAASTRAGAAVGSASAAGAAVAVRSSIACIAGQPVDARRARSGGGCRRCAGAGLRPARRSFRLVAECRFFQSAGVSPRPPGSVGGDRCRAAGGRRTHPDCAADFSNDGCAGALAGKPGRRSWCALPRRSCRLSRSGWI